RRHTRSKRDWSSDVCSSDLGLSESTRARLRQCWTILDFKPDLAEPVVAVFFDTLLMRPGCNERRVIAARPAEPGISTRAITLVRSEERPCRERGCVWVGGGA